MSIRKGISTGLFLTLFWLAPLSSHASDDEDVAAIETIIAAIELGWETADGTPFYAHFLGQDGARFIESGGQNEGLRNLVEHHVEPEGDVLDGLDLVFSNIETHLEGDFAWAIADVEVRAVVKADGRKIHNRGHETFRFRRTADGWKVIHTHSSTRPTRK